MNFLKTTVKDLHQDLIAKELSVSDLTKETFDNIKATDDRYEAFITLMEEQALGQAQNLDKMGLKKIKY